ncbi:sigma-70 family RNA polymerase sigma factor [Clostridium thermarum]|uniref:sigma-70 family RNA polymerase sigma factor n=1 Tax=Clostridium thermarum TaxID=1716543 RepID=UPI001FACE30E|nr:sigma-70 family RNA polymerase sigma factor [Clostridium thermarum]
MGFFLKHKQKENKTEEIERMIDMYGNDVLRTAYMYLKDTQKAEDAFQEVFIKVLKNYDRFKGHSSEKTWLMSITINTCKDILKSFWSQKVVQEEDYLMNAMNDGIEKEAIRNIENEQLYKRVLELPVQYKEVIILFYYHSYSTVEIGKILGVPEGTVRSRLTRARDTLKKQIVERSEAVE